MTTPRAFRRQQGKAKRDHFTRRALVSARIFRFEAPTSHAQAERIRLIDQLICLSAKEGLDPVKVFETVARNRHNYDAARHGKSEAIDWYDDYAAQLKAEMAIRDAAPMPTSPGAA